MLDTNIAAIGVTTALLVMFLALPVYVAATKNEKGNGFWSGIIILTVQVMVSTTAYYSLTEGQEDKRGNQIIIAYEKGREAGRQDTL